MATPAATKVGPRRPAHYPSGPVGLAAPPMRRRLPPGQPGSMITTTNLTKRYQRIAAVDGVTFTCEPGTITGFLGRNGAGKSTTLRMITRLTRPPRTGAPGDRGHDARHAEGRGRPSPRRRRPVRRCQPPSRRLLARHAAAA